MSSFLDGMSVKKKIMGLTTAALLVAMLALGIVLNRVITNNEHENFIHESVMQSEQVDNSMNLFLQSLVYGIKQVANDPAMRAGGDITKYMDGTPDASGMIAMDPMGKGDYEANAYGVFQRFGSAHKDWVSVISYGTMDGGYLQYPAINRKKGYDSRARGWFKDTMSSSEDVRITKPFMTSKGTPTIGLFTVVRDNSNQPLGVLGFNVDLPIITELISDIKIGETGYVVLVDGDGVVIADPKHPEIDFKKLTEVELGEMNTLAEAKEGINAVKIDDVKKAAVVYESAKTGYKYITIVDESQLMNPVNSMRTILAVVLVLAMIIVMAATYWLSNSIVKPLVAVQEAASRIAQGDLRDTKLDVNSNDEIGALARSFETMSEKLRGLIQRIQGSSQEVYSSSDQLSNGAEQCTQNIIHVAETVGAISESSQQQSNALDTVVDNIRIMTEKAADISSSAEVMSQTSHKAGKAAEDGNEAIEQAIYQMQKIQDTVDESAAAVKVLGESSKEIGEIVGTISAIAEQTNLLSLNAAIEAARAGEHGKGFSVVAEEVRKLAEQSGEAADKIASIIKGIQSQTDQAVRAMENGTGEVRAGNEVMNKAGVQFEAIAENIIEVDRLIREAVEQASSVADSSMSVLEAAEQVQQETQKVSSNIDTISASTEEQSASMEEIAASSQKLAHMADSLRDEANKFKF